MAWQNQHDDNHRRQLALAKKLRERPAHIEKTRQDAANHLHNMAESEQEDLRVRQENLRKR